LQKIPELGGSSIPGEHGASSHPSTLSGREQFAPTLTAAKILPGCANRAQDAAVVSANLKSKLMLIGHTGPPQTRGGVAIALPRRPNAGLGTQFGLAWLHRSKVRAAPQGQAWSPSARGGARRSVMQNQNQQNPGGNSALSQKFSQQKPVKNFTNITKIKKSFDHRRSFTHLSLAPCLEKKLRKFLSDLLMPVSRA